MMAHEPEVTEQTMETVLERIEHSDDREITHILNAISARYANYYPDWELLILSMHKDPDRRKEDIESICRTLKQTYE